MQAAYEEKIHQLIFTNRVTKPGALLKKLLKENAKTNDDKSPAIGKPAKLTLFGKPMSVGSTKFFSQEELAKDEDKVELLQQLFNLNAEELKKDPDKVAMLNAFFSQCFSAKRSVS